MPPQAAKWALPCSAAHKDLLSTAWRRALDSSFQATLSNCQAHGACSALQSSLMSGAAQHSHQCIRASNSAQFSAVFNGARVRQRLPLLCSTSS